MYIFSPLTIYKVPNYSLLKYNNIRCAIDSQHQDSTSFTTAKNGGNTYDSNNQLQNHR